MQSDHIQFTICHWVVRIHLTSLWSSCPLTTYRPLLQSLSPTFNDLSSAYYYQTYVRVTAAILFLLIGNINKRTILKMVIRFFLAYENHGLISPQIYETPYCLFSLYSYQLPTLYNKPTASEPTLSSLIRSDSIHIRLMLSLVSLFRSEH